MASPQCRLFPMDLPSCQWVEFPAVGFGQPVSGVIYRTAQPPCCGVPLGGIGTGCLDIDARGVYGFSSIFNPKAPLPRWSATSKMTRKLPRPLPILGLAAGEKTWVLAAEEFVRGDEIPWCTDPRSATDPDDPLPQRLTNCPPIEAVEPAGEIQYWGHYPVADMEFETGAPVSVGVRAWAPFIPGDTAASNIPAAVFEVRLRNSSSGVQEGTIACNFPGPDGQEAMGAQFARRTIKEDFEGTLVRSTAGVSYVLGVIGDETVRLGAGLHSSPAAWSKIASELPQPTFQECGAERLYPDGSASAAIDFSLSVGEEKTVRFLLAWHAPLLEGANKAAPPNVEQLEMLKSPWLASRWAGGVNYYTHMYAARYESALDVARHMALEHESLLKRVLAWQEVVYDEQLIPVWLRDCLVNNLCLIAEDSYWVQAKEPLGDWVYPAGAFIMNESPRGCPHMCCIPCDWLGTLPIVLFFPELSHSMMKMFKHCQLDDGEVPFALGRLGSLPDCATPEYFWQCSLNGTCYVSLVDRLWQRTGDDAVLREFYDSVKRCNTFTMNLASGPVGVVSMPDRGGSEWLEFGQWHGVVVHVGGLHLAQLRIMGRMAQHMGDIQYSEQCRQWFADGSRTLEDELWSGSHYLNWVDKESGRKSEEVMAFQADGHFMARHHGLVGVFLPERLDAALDTVQRCNLSLAPQAGAVNFARADGSPIAPGKDLTGYGADSVFPANALVLAATYMYADKKEVGLKLAHRIMANLVLRQRHAWDLPNIVRGDTGVRTYGSDYYQMMILWALPAAMEGSDLAATREPDSLVDRIIRAERVDPGMALEGP